MYTIVYKGHFDSAHYLNNYSGKCKNLHGHRFHYEIYINKKELDDIGISIDFNDIKKSMKEIEDKVDHKCLNDLFEINPTAENISKWLFEQIEISFPKVVVEKVVIWDSENAGIEYKNDSICLS